MLSFHTLDAFHGSSAHVTAARDQGGEGLGTGKGFHQDCFSRVGIATSKEYFGPSDEKTCGTRQWNQWSCHRRQIKLDQV
jgi:hypothetical protein